MVNQTFLQKFYQERLAFFETKSLDELLSFFNKEVGCNGWSGTRGAHLRALRESIDAICQKEKIELDSTIFKKDSTSYKRKIELRDNRISAI